MTASAPTICICGARKKTYPTRAVAVAVAAKCVRKRRAGTLRIYRCPQGWHLASVRIH